MASTLPTLNDETFAAALRDADRPLLVEFTAAWCPPCHAMVPILEAIARARADITIVTVDVDDARGVASTWGVRAMPTLMLFQKGRPVAQLVGAQSRARLEAWLEEHAARPWPLTPTA